MKNSKGICCYIDILGFKEFIKENQAGARSLLENYQHQLEDENLTSYSSFKYFIPFSDSIFIYTEKENASNFVMQLSKFIEQSYRITSDAYSRPENPEHPEDVTLKGYALENDIPTKKSFKAKWYPLLFRGGIGYDEIEVSQLRGILKNEAKFVGSIFGKSVVEAVKYEQSGLKGPRVFCGKDFYNLLDNNAKKIVHPAFDNSELYEVNWTAVNYLNYKKLDEKRVDILLINEFNMEFLIPASNLWKAYNHLIFSNHYYCFLKLIIKGVQHFFSNTEYIAKVNNSIKHYLKEVDLEIKINDLMS